MQATVRSFDPASHSGSVLLDSGIELPFPATALAGSELRLLRLGQRVRVRVDADGRSIRALTIATFPLGGPDDGGPIA